MKSAIRSRAHQETQDDGKVLVGDASITFDSIGSAGKPEMDTKAPTRHAATEDAGKVRLGDASAPF